MKPTEANAMNEVEQTEYNALDMDGKSLYREAIACGATHDDAMEADSRWSFWRRRLSSPSSYTQLEI